MKWVEDNEVLKFQSDSAENLILKNQIKSVFEKSWKTYCIIHHKIQMNLFDKFAKCITLKVF